MIRRFVVMVTLAIMGVVPTVSYPAEAVGGMCQGVGTNDDRTTDDADYLTGTPDRDVVNLGAGDDQYFGSGGNDLVCGAGGNDLIAGEDANDTLLGQAGADQLVGLSSDDVLNGGPGSDSVDGGDGDDVVRGGAPGETGSDDLYDGPGSDDIFGGDNDVWHRCADGDPDNRSGFTGEIVDTTDC